MEAVPAEVIEPEMPLGRGVAAHVQQHLGTDTIAQRDAHLGETVGQADEKVEDRLQEVFGHHVGRLATSTADDQISQGTDADVWSGPAVATGQVAADVIQMLRSPQHLRQAFILSEILKRRELPR
jgi:hypothetical protein